MGIALKIDAKAVPTPSAIIPPESSLLVASLFAPPIVVALISPIVSIVVTMDINNISITAPQTKSIPYCKGIGNANQSAAAIFAHLTSPSKAATMNPATIPIRIEAADAIPFPLKIC